jgi:hypothetical protein
MGVHHMYFNSNWPSSEGESIYYHKNVVKGKNQILIFLELCHGLSYQRCKEAFPYIQSFQDYI